MNIKKKSVLFVFLLIPFFELYTLDILASRGYFPQIIGIMGKGMSLLRLAISCAAIIYTVYGKKHLKSYSLICMTLFFLSCVLSSFLNGSLYFSYLIGVFNYLGFMILCKELIREDFREFIQAVVLLFGVLSILAAACAVVLPNGFFHDANKAYAVYFLGSKNSAFLYYMVFLYSLLLYEMTIRRQISWFVAGIIVFLLLSCKLYDSSNSIMCILIVFAYYLLEKNIKQVVVFIRAKWLLVVSALVALLLISSANNKLIKRTVTMLGRNTSYTGRDVLWQQALEGFVKHPLIGNGIQTEFQLASKAWASHAHDVFLDLLAKYGLFTCVLFIMSAVVVVWSFCRLKNWSIIRLNGIVLFSLTLHNVFDDMPFFFWGLFLIMMEFSTMFDFICQKDKTEEVTDLDDINPIRTVNISSESV